MQNISCDNQIYLHENNKIIFISLASHVASLSNRGLVQLGNDLLATLRLRDRRGRNGCLSALWDWRPIRMKARTRRKKWSYRRLMYWVESFLSQRNIAQCPSILKRWLACRGAKLSGKRLKELIKTCDGVIRTILGDRGSQSGQEKRRDEIFQAQAEKTLGTDSNGITNGQVNAGSWLGTEDDLYYCAQSANSFSLVLFVSSYTTAIISLQLPCSFTKLS